MKQRDFDCFREPADHICSQYRRKNIDFGKKSGTFSKFFQAFFQRFFKNIFWGPKKKTAQKSKAFDMT